MSRTSLNSASARVAFLRIVLACVAMLAGVAALTIGAAAPASASPAGATWTSRQSAADNDWRAVAFGNGRYVAVAQSGVGNRAMTSPGGITWTIRSTPKDNNWSSITYGK